MHICEKKPMYTDVRDLSFIRWYFSNEEGRVIYYCNHCGVQFEIKEIVPTPTDLTFFG
jgi:hypothetical protein